MVILLRIIHIVTGAFWAGAVLFLSLLLIPTIEAVGPAGAPVMGQLIQVRRLPVVLVGAAWITLLSGAVLMWHDARLAGPSWFASGPGRTFSIGAALAVIATLIGMTVNAPAARQMAALSARLQAAGQPPSSEDQATLARLRGRLMRATQVATVFVVLALIAMAVARYVR